MQGDEHASTQGWPPPAPDLDAPSVVDQDMADRSRAQRWAGRIIAVAALSSVAPLAYLVAERRRDEVVAWLASLVNRFLGPAAMEGGETSSVVGFVTVVALIGGVGGFLLLGVVRKWVSRRRVRRALASGTWRPGSSLNLVLTILAWALLFTAVAVVATVSQAMSDPNTSDVAQHFVDQPAWLALTALGFAAAVAWSNWSHRRREESAPLVAAGLLPAVGPDHPSGPVAHDDAGGRLSLRQGLRAFVWVLVIDGAFGVVGWIDLLLADGETSLGTYVGDWLTMTLLFPGMYVMAWLVLFAVVPGMRWMVRRVLRERWVVAALGLGIGGLVVAAVTGGLSSSSPGPVATVALVAAIAGVLVATITSLGVQDVGPQPWLGLLFLALLWLTGFQDMDTGSFGLPGSVLGWVVAALVTAFAVREGVILWREHLGTARVPRGT